MLTRKEINKEKLIPCHVITKTVGNVPVFSEKEDCFRFIFQMHAANIGKPGFNLRRKDIVQASKDLLAGKDIDFSLVKPEHSPLVNIISFALLKDHAHFILSANKEGGISKFISKVNLGFAKYFNMKNRRFGVLFNKPFKIAAVCGNKQLNVLACYVNIKSPLEVSDNLAEYPFSSFLDLFGNRNSRITISKAMAKQLGINFEKAEDYVQELKNNQSFFLE